MPMNNRFQTKTFGPTVYPCRICGKQTRETGYGESSADLCAYCYQVEELSNGLSDGAMTQEEHDEAIAELKAKYKR